MLVTFLGQVVQLFERDANPTFSHRVYPVSVGARQARALSALTDSVVDGGRASFLV
jgi:hypothetical protein